MNRIERRAALGAAFVIASAALVVSTKADAGVTARVGVSVSLVAPGVAVSVGTPAGYCDAWGRRAPARVRVFVRFPFPHWEWQPVFAPSHGYVRHGGAWRAERFERHEGWRRGGHRGERRDRDDDRRDGRRHDRHRR